MNTERPPKSDIIDQIPDPDTLRGQLAESVRRTELLRSLLKLSIRKSTYNRTADGCRKGGAA